MSAASSISDQTPLISTSAGNNKNSQSSSSSAITVIPNAVISTVTFLTRALVYTAKVSTGAYIGSRLSVTPNYAILRTGVRDRYVLLQSSIDFPIFHRKGEGLPKGFKIYRMRKGWRAGLFGWDPSSWTGGLMRRGWEDVTPHVELKTSSTSGMKLTYSGDDIVVTPGKGFIKELGTYDLDKEQVNNNGGNAGKVVDTKGFTEVTHVSVHVPVDKTPDGFYRFVVCDDRNKILIVSPEYTLHSSFTSFGILRGSSIPALPIQFVGFLIKNAIAGVVSTALTALYFTGGLPGGIAVRIFMWFYKQQVEDAKQKAWQFVKEKGAVKPLDYLARGAGGGLPGSAGRFEEYEREWDGKTGSWVVRNVERGVFRA